VLLLLLLLLLPYACAQLQLLLLLLLLAVRVTRQLSICLQRRPLCSLQVVTTAASPCVAPCPAEQAFEAVKPPRPLTQAPADGAVSAPYCCCCCFV
jgi:hypothetical protein